MLLKDLLDSEPKNHFDFTPFSSRLWPFLSWFLSPLSTTLCSLFILQIQIANNSRSPRFPVNCNNCDYYLHCRGGGGAAVNQETRHLALLWPRLCVFCGQGGSQGVQEGQGAIICQLVFSNYWTLFPHIQTTFHSKLTVYFFSININAVFMSTVLTQS